MTHVLIVEDQKQSRELLQILLRGAGYQVTTAGDGIEALAAARHEPPAVIVSDGLMPKMDGFDLCRAWMQDERLRTIPFVFYSATYTEAGNRRLGLALGAVRYLIKPLKPEAFLQELRVVLQEWAKRPAPGPAAPLEDGAYYALHDATLARKLERKIAQLEATNRKLSESETRFRSLTEISSDYYWESDVDHRITARSAGIETSTKWALPAGSLIGKRRWEAPYRSPDEAGWQAHRAVLDAHQPFRNFEFSRPHADGGERHFSISANPEFDESGAFKGYRGVGSDISQRKAAEARIQRLTNLYAALSQCNEAIVRSGSEEELFPQVCRTAVQYGGMKAARVSLVDFDTRMARVVASSGYGNENLHDLEVSIDADSPLGQGPTGTAIRENRPFWCQDFMNEPLTAPWHERGARLGWGSVAALPLHRNGAVVGAFVVFDGETNAFDEPRRQLLLEMAMDISYALDHFLREAERRQSEQELRKLSHAIEQSPTSVLITDTQGRIEYVNPKFTQSTGYSVAEVIGRNPRLLKSGETSPESYRELWKTITSGAIWRGEFHNRRKDGTLFWESATISPVVGDDGRVTHYIGIKEDITERKQAEQALRRSEQRLRLALNSARMTPWEWIVESNTLTWSEPPQELIGPEPAAGYADFHKIVHPDDREGFIEAGKLAITQRTAYHTVFRITRTDGLERWIESQGVFLDGEGDERGERIIGVSQDITARKLHEDELRRLNEELEQRVDERTHALQAANRELEAFSYSVSHDLRAPLRAINGFGRIIEDEFAAQLGERGMALFVRIRAGVERMNNLIDDLLALSQISRQSIRVGPVDLSALAREVADELQSGESLRRVEWVIAQQVIAEGDEGLLKVMLQNLIGNAWKYSSKREAARIEFGIDEKDGQSVYFVRDNGAGFDMAYVRKLFGAFQRLHSTAEFPGNGIGLATVARIIRRHGGEIRAEGRPGAGASFYFTLGSMTKAS